MNRRAPVSNQDLAQLLTQHRERILAIASRFGVRDVRVFGSVARGDARSMSDVDLLVRLDDGRSLFDLGSFQQEVQQLLGCDVHVALDHDHETPFADRARRESRAL